METRANHVWVGVVTLLLLAGLAALVIWIARLNHVEQREYDIFFHQSVDGLAKGSNVSISGVPAGQVSEIALWEKDPSLVRVRITLDKKVPILVGTTASLQGSFTGVTTVQLAGAPRGSPEITQPGRDGVPEIPTRRAGLGEILANAPLLLERITALTDRASMVLSDKNLKAFSNTLANADRLSGALADAAPEIRTTLVELQTATEQATTALASVQDLANSTNTSLNDQQTGVVHDMHQALQAAGSAAASLQALLDETRPGVHQLNDRTLPAAEAAIHELQASTHALHDMTDTIRDRGIGSLVNGAQLPDYKH